MYQYELYAYGLSAHESCYDVVLVGADGVGGPRNGPGGAPPAKPEAAEIPRGIEETCPGIC